MESWLVWHVELATYVSEALAEIVGAGVLLD
jgi:hypothetical protein